MSKTIKARVGETRIVTSSTTKTFTLNQLPEHAEIQTVFDKSNKMTNVALFTNFMKILNNHYSKLVTPMRNQSEYKIPDIANNDSIKYYFGEHQGCQTVNTVRTIIIRLLPNITGKGNMYYIHGLHNQYANIIIK